MEENKYISSLNNVYNVEIKQELIENVYVKVEPVENNENNEYEITTKIKQEVTSSNDIPHSVEIKQEHTSIEIKIENVKSELKLDEKTVDKEKLLTEVNQTNTLEINIEKLNNCRKTASQKAKEIKITDHLCELCKRYFATRNSLHKHKKYSCIFNNERVQRQYARISCNLCNKVVTKKNLTDHKKYYCSMNENKVKYKRKAERHPCSQCNKVYTRKDTLDIHRRINHVVNSVRFECDYCGKRYLRKLNLRNHMKIVHLHIKVSSLCKFCNKEFFDKTNRDRHVKLHCPVLINRCYTYDEEQI